MARQGSGFTEALRDITLSRYHQGPPAPERCGNTKMASFKVKLVLYFLLLSLLPMAAAFWGFSTVAARAETRRVDARLQAELRATIAGYQARLEAAAATAGTLARNPRFEQALMRRDRRALDALLRRKPFLTVVGSRGFRVGPEFADAATRQVAVVGPGG